MAFCRGATANKFVTASYQVGILYPRSKKYILSLCYNALICIIYLLFTISGTAKQNSSTLIITLILLTFTFENCSILFMQCNNFPNIPSGNSNILFAQCSGFPNTEDSNTLFMCCNSFLFRKFPGIIIQ